MKKSKILFYTITIFLVFITLTGCSVDADDEEFLLKILSEKGYIDKGFIYIDDLYEDNPGFGNEKYSIYKKGKDYYAVNTNESFGGDCRYALSIRSVTVLKNVEDSSLMYDIHNVDGNVGDVIKIEKEKERYYPNDDDYIYYEDYKIIYKAYESEVEDGDYCITVKPKFLFFGKKWDIKKTS